NKRLFDVSIEGNTVLNNLDLYAEAGHDAALRYEFKEIDVTDGRLNVAFTASKDAAKISGISVRTSPPSAPQLEVSPTTLSFGTDSNTQQLTIQNSGTADLTWSINENPDQEWIESITPSNGTLTGGSSQTVVVSMNRDGLAGGSYAGTLTVDSNGGQTDVAVSMEVAEPAAQLSINPVSLDFGNQLDELHFTIHNSGDFELTWNASIQSGADWISSIIPLNGTLSVNQKDSVSVQIDRSNLNDGQYEGSIIIQSDAGSHEILLRMSVEALPVWRINAGGGEYVDQNGNIWNADQAYGTTSGYGFVGGKTYSTTDPISNTEDDILYQSERYEISAYNFLVPAGTFDVSIHLAEIYHKAANKRLMDIIIEDNSSLQTIDIYNEVGHDAALKYTIAGITVTDGRLDIQFIGTKDYAKVSAIEVKMTAFQNNLLKRYGTANRLVDTMAPSAPAHISIKEAARKAFLMWDDIEDPDFDNYRIYRKNDDNESTFKLLSFNYYGTTFVDSTIREGHQYLYSITSVDVWGNESEITAKNTICFKASEIPETFCVKQNYPNPFNGSTKINYQLKEDSYVTLRIFDITGRQICTLVDDMKTIGHHSTVWHAKNEFGHDLSSGVYLYQFKAGNFTKIRRMLLVK
ncbi:choice-of-anchor D domain-containing protein, partial [candidate division KSB1 bacterium]|nr:choice-of-anchor D domain-containing protein [candidate division KSB1 bacterium]